MPGRMLPESLQRGVAPKSLDFGRLASRTVREHVPIISCPPGCGTCYRPRKGWDRESALKCCLGANRSLAPSASHRLFLFPGTLPLTAPRNLSSQVGGPGHGTLTVQSYEGTESLAHACHSCAVQWGNRPSWGRIVVTKGVRSRAPFSASPHQSLTCCEL